MDLRKVSALGRPLDWKYKTNRAIAIITLSLFIIGVIFQLIIGKDILSGAKWSIEVSLAIFFIWAISRELDPDNDLSAFWSVVIGVIPLAIFGFNGILNLLWIMLLLRVINRSTGLIMGFFDGIIILALTTWLSFNFHCLYSVIAFSTFLIDALLPGRNKKQFGFAIGAVIIFLFSCLSDDGQMVDFFLINDSQILIVVILVILFGAFIFLLKNVKSVGDETNIQLSTQRIKITNGLFLSIIILHVFFLGTAGFFISIPLIACAIGVSLFKIKNLSKHF